MRSTERPGLSLGVLGGVWAAIDGVEVNLGGPRQRAVLGVLIAARGNVVTLDQIVDAVWEDDPPATVTSTVQSYVSNLRRALEPGRGARQMSRVLVTTPAGYVLRVDPDAVDAWRFENLALRAASIEDADARRMALDKALGGWVGEPFADLGASAWVAAESARLYQVRWSALERMSEALRTLGAHAEAEERARSVTVDAPLREEAWRLLALAQQAAGRTGDALATLRGARGVLAAELGIDPGPALVHLEQQLLHRDEAPAAATVAAAPADGGSVGDAAADVVGAVPVEHGDASGVVGAPTQLRALVGRDDEIEWLVRAVTDESSSRLVTISGAGGIGKTRLALAVAEQVSGRFDETRFVTLQTVADIAAVWSLLAQEFEAGQGAEDVQAALVQALSTCRVLLVLDNLEHLDGMDVVVSALLEAPQLHLLATSRRPLLLAGEQEFGLDALPLPVDDSVAAIEASAAGRFFCECARAARSSFVLTDETAPPVAGLCRRLDGFPLALELAAAQLRFFGPAALLAHLDEHLSVDVGRGVTAGDRPDRHRTLGAAIAYSHDLLGDQDQVLFRRLGVFAGPVAIDAVSAVTGVEPLLAAEIYDGLVRLNLAGLVRIDSTGEQPRIGMFDTIRDYARLRLDQAGEIEALRRRHLSWCRDLTTEAWHRFNFDDDPSALDVLPVIADEVRAALRYGLDGDSNSMSIVKQAVDILNAVAIQWLHTGSSAEARSWIDQASLIHDPGDLSRHLELRRQRVVLDLVVKSDTMNGVTELQQIAALAPIGDALLVARIHHTLSLAWGNAQNHEESLRAALLVISAFDQSGAKRLLRATRTNAIEMAVNAERYDVVLELSRTCMIMYAGNPIAEIVSRTLPAPPCAGLGDLSQAGRLPHRRGGAHSARHSAGPLRTAIGGREGRGAAGQRVSPASRRRSALRLVGPLLRPGRIRNKSRSLR